MSKKKGTPGDERISPERLQVSASPIRRSAEDQAIKDRIKGQSWNESFPLPRIDSGCFGSQVQSIFEAVVDRSLMELGDCFISMAGSTVFTYSTGILLEDM